MFVASVLDEWWRHFGGGCDRMDGSHPRRRYNAKRLGSPEWDEFVKQQRMVWTPPDLFEQCCPRWLASGRLQEFGHTTGATTTHPSEDDETQEWPCTGCCNKRHPSITLFFDEKRTTTIAVLSHRLDPFTIILDGRVEEGSAIRKSPLYYELKGYLRENLSQLRRHHEHGGLGPHLVKVAMGALKKSDTVQKQKVGSGPSGPSASYYSL
jgi:hypothetical protein